MIYKITTIPPAGRNKYGNYTSTGNITKQIVSYNNGGNATTNNGKNGGSDDGTTNDTTPKKNYSLILSKTSSNFEWDDIIAQKGQVDVINVLGFGELDNIPTFVGDIQLEANKELTTTDLRNYDIKGLPPKGVEVEVKNNGTSATTIEIKVTEDIPTTRGTLQIPCSIYIGSENTAPYLPSVDKDTGAITDNTGQPEDYYDWVSVQEDCKTIWLQYSFTVIMNAVNNYTLELTNEIAGINCGSDGKILANAIRPTCQAKLYYGEKKVDTATYGMSYSLSQNVVGVSIDTTTGIVTFGSNFNFDGTNLELNIYGTDKDNSVTKIMSIHKIYGGKDGSPAVNRWIEVRPDVITYNPNTNTFSENTITTVVKEQVGDAAPTTVNIPHYYGWDTKNPITECEGPISVEFGKQYLCVALKDDYGIIYESETVPIINEGHNGAKGESAYNLVITNQNATILCDYEGNILPVKKPTCQAYLYYGTTIVEDIVYSVSSDAWGVSFNGNELIFGDDFGFLGDNVELKIYAKKGSTTMATAIMSITKVKEGAPGADGGKGADAVRFYLSFDYNLFKVSSGGTYSPDHIEVSAYRQVGSNVPVNITNNTNVKILYGINTNTPSLVYTNGIPYNSIANFFTVALKYNGVEVDRQSIPVLRDGVKGSQGAKGPSIRGPIDYNKVNDVRRFCNGVLTDSKHPEDGEWIDIISVVLPMETKRRYYKCIKSHDWDPRDIDEFNGGVMDTCWEEADQFNFIATDVLLADQANIANFVFSDGKLVSQERNEDGSPTLELDGNIGVINANKGNFKGSIWQNFVSVDNGATLDINKQNVELYQSYYDDTYDVYLPKITPDMDGVRFCVYWNGIGTRSSYSNQFLCVSPNYEDDYDRDWIYDFDCMDPTSFQGTPLPLTKIWCDYFCYGYAELVAKSFGAGNGGEWIVTTRNGSNFWATCRNTYDPSTNRFTYNVPEDQKIETYKQRFLDNRD